MSILIFPRLIFAEMAVEAGAAAVDRFKARRAERIANNERVFSMVTVLCLLLFPVALLAELLKISK